MAERPRPEPKRLAAYALVTAFVGTGAFSLVAANRDANRMPKEPVIAAAREAILDAYTTGDALRPLPLWFESPRIGMGQIPMLLSEDLENHLDLPSYERVFELRAGPALRRADLSPLLSDDDDVVFEAPKLRVSLRTVASPFEVVWDAYDEVRSSVVTREDRQGRTELCTTWTREGYHCGGTNDWHHVTASHMELDDTPRRCINANPRPDGELLSVHWPNVPTGDVLRIRSGITIDSLRSDRGSDVQFRVLIDGEPAHERTVGRDTYGYEYVEIERADWTREGADDENVDVRVEIQAEDMLDRFFCFRAQMADRVDAR